ncbi:MAG TPA: site-specific integrase [Rubrobacter sp.]
MQTAKGPKRHYVSGKTRREVEEKLTKAKAERDGGLVFDAGNLTLNECLDRWLSGSVRNTVKQSTFENYEYVVRLHLKPSLGRTKLKVLAPAQVQGLYRAKLDSGLSARTYQLIHTVLRKALKQAVRWELVPRNVTDAVTTPKLAKGATKGIRVLNADQARNLLGAARGDRLEALYVLAITARLREGELLGLRWQDVDLEGATLSVSQQLTRTKKDGLCFTMPKSPKSRRSVRLTRSAVEALERHRRRQLEEKSRLAELWQDTGLVFTSTTGTPLDVGNLTYRSFRPLLEQADLARIRFHDLRHTCATLLLSKNVNPKVVQERLGHANISETMDTYSHVLPSMQETAVNAMEDVLT